VRGSQIRHANQRGLRCVVQSMKKFAAKPSNDTSFWQLAPFWANLPAEGRLFS
jgi:hypothetical protein